LVKYGVPILKKLLFLLLLTPLLFASDLKTEQKIYKLILHTLLPQKSEIKVWCDDKKQIDLIHTIDGIECIDSPQNADLLLISKEKNIETKGMKFVTSYKLLELQNSAVLGGFFWQKGRPNILFMRNTLDKYNIRLPESMQGYIEDSI
jgi:hypothetical protein